MYNTQYIHGQNIPYVLSHTRQIMLKRGATPSWHMCHCYGSSNSFSIYALKLWTIVTFECKPGILIQLGFKCWYFRTKEYWNFIFDLQKNRIQNWNDYWGWWTTRAPVSTPSRGRQTCMTWKELQGLGRQQWTGRLSRGFCDFSSWGTIR